MCPVALNVTAAVPHCRDLMALGEKSKMQGDPKSKKHASEGDWNHFLAAGHGGNALDAPATGTEFKPALNTDSGFDFSGGGVSIHFSLMSLSLSLYPIRHDLLL